ncbi:MAG: radical SAM protein [Promethearchaeota archaeon]
MNKKKSWQEYFEFKIKPFILQYFLFPVRFYRTYLSALKADITTFINYYVLKRRKKPPLHIPVSPRELTIVSANLCNASCVFCAYRCLNYEKKIMSFDTFKKIVDEYKELGGSRLMLSPTIGETLVNKDLFKQINYAKEKGFYITIFTNGILLNINTNYKKIINSGIDEISISTGDIDPNYEAEIFGISKKLALEKIKGILKLLKYKDKTKSSIKVIIAFRAKRSFRKIWQTIQRTKFIYYFKKKDFYIDFKTAYDNWCGTISKDDLLGVMRLKKRPLLRRFPCASLWRLSILANGDVRLCGCRIRNTEKDDLVIGNINIEKFIDIINSKKAKRIFTNWLNGKIAEVCQDCSRYYYPKFIKNNQ